MRGLFKFTSPLLMISIFLTIGLLLSCSHPKVNETESRHVAEDAGYKPGIDTAIGEYKVPGEDKATAELLNLFTKHFQKNYSQPTAKRAVHAKDHGCLDAKFEVLPVDDPDIQHGVFAHPGKYDAVMRISNGDGPPAKDSDSLTSLGMAIKLFGVKEPKLLTVGEKEFSQDLLMINQPAFLVKDIVGFLDVIVAREGGKIAKAKLLAQHLDAILFRRKALPKDDPLNTPFWSVLPFKLGDKAVKYSAAPCTKGPLTVVAQTDDFLKDLVRNHAHNQETCYDFFIQKRVLDGHESEEMPIENARVIWDEKKHPPVKTGRLIIPKQELLAEGYCENLIFSPYNTTADFIPLGNLNRIRKAVYDLSSHKRHEVNRSVNPVSGETP